jgi:hypothetical protein
MATGGAEFHTLNQSFSWAFRRPVFKVPIPFMRETVLKDKNDPLILRSGHHQGNAVIFLVG